MTDLNRYQTQVKVHLQNIQSNIEAVRHSIGETRKILVAVKANAYGHGAVEVSRMAEKIGVAWLGVSSVLEGSELRKAGISLPILKFSPAFPEEMQVAINHDVTLTVCEINNIKTLNNVAEKSNTKINVHLKVDTGMGRIGVSPDHAPEMARFIENECPYLYLEGVFTHFPSSDEGDLLYTQDQISRFKTILEKIHTAIGRKVSLVHAANSGGVLAHPESWFDMVRPGIMVYGFYPCAETPRSITLKPGLSFLTRVSYLKKVIKGTPISYGRTWLAPEDTWIATFPAGYADGFNRLFSNQGRVLINGKSYPVVGRVCMDQTMVNLGPETDVCVGDEVVLIGRSGEQEITAYEWADKLNTITYEVVCQINHRVPRIYDAYD
jgi:alanine racemase